jgi:hypothetical protein
MVTRDYVPGAEHLLLDNKSQSESIRKRKNSDSSNIGLLQSIKTHPDA